MRQNLRESLLKVEELLAVSSILFLTVCCSPQYPAPDGSDCFDKERIKLELPGIRHGILPISETDGLCSYYDTCSLSTYFLYTDDGFHTLNACSQIKGKLVSFKQFRGMVYAVTSKGKWYSKTETAVYRSEDSGKTWISLPIIMGFSADSFDISDDGVLCLTDYGYVDLDRVLLSYDQGNNWIEPPIKIHTSAMVSNGLLFFDFRTDHDDLYLYDFKTGKVSDIPWKKYYLRFLTSDDIMLLVFKGNLMKYEQGRMRKTGKLPSKYFGERTKPLRLYKKGHLTYLSTYYHMFRQEDEYNFYFSTNDGRTWKWLGSESYGFKNKSSTLSTFTGYKENLYYIINDTLYIARPKFKVH